MTKKFIELARFCFYSKEEIKVLSNILDKYNTGWDNTDGLGRDIWYFCSYDGLMDVSEEDIQVMWDQTIQNINFLQYLLVYHHRVFLFLTCVPLEKVPLYIASKGLEHFAEWRLKIGK